jgi:branched-chain amino acid transport system ATP-binding protein
VIGVAQRGAQPTRAGMAEHAPLLLVRDLHAYYGKSHILQGVDFRVAAGEIVSLLGRNGVGRSTTIRAIMGSVASTGSVLFKGEEMVGLKPHQIAHCGLGYVPENRDVFPALTVRENLMLGVKKGQKTGRWRVEDFFEIFPQLRERADTPAGVLSGGEQQLLTMSRTLMGDPDLIMVDEPTEGLAPRMVELVGQLLIRIAERGVAILLVEQKLTIALRISQRIYVMGHGRMVYEGTPAELQADDSVRAEWLQV